MTPATIASLVIAVSFAAGLNVYATTLTLGVMARLHWVVLPASLDMLTSWWVIAASSLLFAAEFVADKIPGFDLIWNAAHTFVRIPVALLLAYGATTHLSPELQILVTVLGGAIAAITHGSKLAVRGAATASPEPLSNIALSTTEDVAAVAVTSIAAHHPFIAGAVAASAILAALLMARVAIRAIQSFWRRLKERFRASPIARNGTRVSLLIAGTLYAVLGASSTPSNAQTLARPGWAGSGLNVQPWWKHAVIYEIDTRSFQDSNGDGDLKGIAERLDYLKSLGVDAVLLDSFALTKPLDGSATVGAPIDPSVGTLDDFDDLVREASRNNIRVLLNLNQGESNGDPSLLPVARYWLNRGVAGFHLVAASKPGADPDVPGLRRLMASYAGQRVLIADAGIANLARQSPGGLLMDFAMRAIAKPPSPNLAAQIRLSMEQSQTLARAGTPLLATDGLGTARSADRFGDGTHDVSIAKILATVLLLNRSASLIYLGQELSLHSPAGNSVAMPWGAVPVAVKPEVQGVPVPAASKSVPTQVAPDRYVPYVPPAAAKPAPTTALSGEKRVAHDLTSFAAQDANPKSVLNFYRQLSQLHHGNPALRDGEQILLNHDDVNALVWVRKPQSVTPLTPAVVIVCNLSTQPLVLPLKAELTQLHLRGSFLRTILRSDDAMGSMHLDPITVPSFGVYIGELRY